jgi:putative transposase
MSRKYKFRDNDKLYFISFACVGWVDVFIRNEYREVILESWRYCQREKDLEIYAWVIMTSHVHMIIGSKGRAMDKIVGEMKSYTSRQLRKMIEGHNHESRKEWMLEIFYTAGNLGSNTKDWQFWRQDNKPIEIDNDTKFYEILEYVHQNPVEAGFVRKAEDYVYSSAGDFYGMPGLVELSYIV